MNEAAAAGWRLQVHESLPSTSDLCRALAAGGEPAGLAVLAARQSRGRGSRGRNWESPPGNLYLSALLRPDEPARDVGQWALLAAVAVAEALDPWLPAAAGLRLKWPNDLLLAGRKLGGILVESEVGPQERLAWLVLGIGVNLAAAPALAERPAAAVGEFAAPPSPPALAAAVLAALDRWRGVRQAQGFAAVRAAWLARAAAPGERVTLRLGGAHLAGSFAGLGEDGSLLLEAGGRRLAFGAGEVLAAAGEGDDGEIQACCC